MVNPKPASSAILKEYVKSPWVPTSSSPPIPKPITKLEAVSAAQIDAFFAKEGPLCRMQVTIPRISIPKSSFALFAASSIAARYSFHAVKSPPPQKSGDIKTSV